MLHKSIPSKQEYPQRHFSRCSRADDDKKRKNGESFERFSLFRPEKARIMDVCAKETHLANPYNSVELLPKTPSEGEETKKNNN